MNALEARRELLVEKSYWDAVAERLAEHATLDAQSGFSFRVAQQKLVAINHALSRVEAGTFGLCDVCGAAIEEQRLRALLLSDCHLCARCASTLRHSREDEQSARNIEYRRPSPLQRQTGHITSRIVNVPA
jgi:RNA polymerase-binding transcription factor DksA